MSPRRRPPRALVAVAAAASVFATAGCVGLPSTSSVAPGKAVDAKDDSEPLAVEPLTASAYDDPRQIATGFLRAQMSAHDDYQAARTFLTGDASRRWKPGTAVTVFAGDSDITATRPDTTTVRLSVPVVATIDADGHLVRQPSTTRRDLRFTVSSTAGGWRLSQVPDGLGVWISSTDVARLFSRVNVYYPAAYGRSLVPDPRLLPRQGLATALARAALSAPPQWLRPAIATSLPTGTALAVDAVPVRDGEADVALSSRASAADNPARAALWASVTATVMQAPEVRSVSVRVGGARLETDNLPAQVSDPSQVGYSITADSLDEVISRSGAYLAWTHARANDSVSGTDARAAQGRPVLPAVPADWSLLAAGQGGRQIAAISKDRTSVRRWLNGTDVTVPDLGNQLVRPAFDSSGWLWVAGRTSSASTPSSQASRSKRTGDTSSAALWALDTTSTSPTRTPTALDVPWLGASSVTSLSVSPEGSRVALTIRDGDDARAVVAAVERDERGRPVSLGPAHDISPGVHDVKDVVWADGTSLAVLGTSDGLLQPTLVPLDDAPVPLGGVTGASSLVSTLDGRSGLFVRTDANTVFTRQGSSWSSFLTRGDLIAPRS